MTLKDYLKGLKRKYPDRFDKIIEVSSIFLAQLDRENIESIRGKYFKVYGEMVERGSLSNLLDETNKEIKDLENRIRDLKNAIRLGGNEAREERQNLIRKRATLMNYCIALEELETTGETNWDTAFNDWGVISGLRGLRKISFSKSSNGIEYPILSFRIYYPYNGIIYDLGDWDIVFNPDLSYGATHITKRQRSAVRPGWGNNYPNYEYDNGAFCLGEYSSYIDDLRAYYRFSEAFSTIVNCFHSINDESEERDIPKCFFEVEAEGRAIYLLDDYLREEGLIK